MTNVPLYRINNNYLHLGPEQCLNYWLLSVVFSYKKTGRQKAVKMATQKSNLTPQKLSLQLGKKYLCEECGFKVTKKSHLTRHQQSVQMGKKYPCEECDNKFTLKSSLTRQQQSVPMGKK